MLAAIYLFQFDQFAKLAKLAFLLRSLCKLAGHQWLQMDTRTVIGIRVSDVEADTL